MLSTLVAGQQTQIAQLTTLEAFIRQEFTKTVDDVRDAAPMTSPVPGNTTLDDRDPKTLKDFLALTLQEVRSIDEGGSRKRDASNDPLLFRLFGETTALQDGDGNHAVFGVDFFLDVPINRLPDSFQGTVRRLMKVNGSVRRISWEEYRDSLPSAEDRKAISKIAQTLGW